MNASKKPAARRPTARKAPVVGKTYNYTVKGKPGRGKVESVSDGKTGSWVTLRDADRPRLVTVRPSQLSGGR
jgi:hypothetical protein